MEQPALDTVVKGRRMPRKQLFGLPVTGDLAVVSNRKQGNKALLTYTGAPQGAALVGLLVLDAAQAKALVAATARAAGLDESQACDVSCLLHGAFSPLEGFMEEPAYDSVVKGRPMPEEQLLGMPAICGQADASDQKL